MDTLTHSLTHRPSQLSARSIAGFKSGIADKMANLAVPTLIESNNTEQQTTSSSLTPTPPIIDSIHPASVIPHSQTVQPDASQTLSPRAQNGKNSGNIACSLQQNLVPEPFRINDKIEPRSITSVDLLRTAHDSPAHEQKAISNDVLSASIFPVNGNSYLPLPVHMILPSPRLGRVELQRRLNETMTSGGAFAAHHICKQIVDMALRLDDEDDTKRRWTIFHTIISIAEPSSASCVARLLDMDEHLVSTVVQSLHPVLITDDVDARIHVYHPSFHNIVLSSTEGKFPFHPPSVHLVLAQACIKEMMTSLRFNICNLESSFTPDSDLKPTLEERTTKHIGEFLTYASKNWWLHTKRCDAAGMLSILPRVETMLKEKGIFWIEVMSLLKSVKGCIPILQELVASSAILLIVPSINLFSSEATKLVRLFDKIPEKITSHLYLGCLGFSGATPDLDCWRAQFPYISHAITQQWQEAQEIPQSDGHTDAVFSAAFSPSGEKIVSGSRDRTVCIWDAESGRKLRQLNGHADCVYSAAFSSDGKRIVSGSDDRTIRVWDVESGEELRQLNGHSKGVRSTAFSPDGKYIVSGSNDGTVRIWDSESGQTLRHLPGNAVCVYSVCFSPDGNCIISGSKDGFIRVWDANVGAVRRQLFGHKNDVLSVGFSPDGTLIVSGSSDQSIRIWDCESGEELRQINGHTHQVHSVAFSHDGKRIVSGSADQVVCIWEAESGRMLWQHKGFTGFVHSVAFSSDGKRVISGSRDKTIRIWDAEPCQEYQELNYHPNDIRTVQFSLRVNGVMPAGHRQSPEFSCGPKLSEQKPVPKGATTSLPSECSNSQYVSSMHLPGQSNFSSTSQPPIELTDSPHSPNTIILSPTSSSLHYRNDGWLVTSKEETGLEQKIVWISPTLKPFDPQALLVIAREGPKSIDFSGCVFGEGWERCYTGRA
ncbi:WD40-repeat-containing domain protein [Flagelloscypha sp. PMI_526]|nr:WD40-repeat-containing domain protein [Flagelloscypha sp. PMI_526]